MKEYTIKELSSDMVICLLFLKTSRRRRCQGRDRLEFLPKEISIFRKLSQESMNPSLSSLCSCRFTLQTFTKVSRTFNLNSADPLPGRKFHVSSITFCTLLQLCFRSIRNNKSLLPNFLDLKITDSLCERTKFKLKLPQLVLQIDIKFM